MTQINLYKHGNAVGPRRKSPDDPLHGFRLVADENMALTNGDVYVYCVDVLIDEVSLWTEVEWSEV